MSLVEVLMVLFFGFSFVIVLAFLFIVSSLKIVNQYERGVKFTLGKYAGRMDPGLRVVIPVIQSWHRIDIRVRTIDVPSQDCVSKDNASLKVNAVLYYNVRDAGAEKAVIEVEDFDYAVSQLAQTTMRNIVGQFELDDILQKRDKISNQIKTIVDAATDPWGIEVTNIELKDVELPEMMKRAMANQAEAERERRARVISSLGEKQSAQSFYDAAKTLAKEPMALHLRFFQTLNDISNEKNSTIILPVPMEMLEFFKSATKK